MPLSAPCRAPMLTAKAVGKELNLKYLNLMGGDQMKPEFIAINPQHVVPTIVDGDFTLWESRAICTYLASQYGEGDSLYPTDPKKRAVVDRFLYFDMGTLYHRFGEYVYPVLFRGQETPDPEKLTKVHEALGWMNSWLEGKKYITGDNVTVADHSLVATISTFDASGLDMSKHTNVLAWFELCKKLPGYDEVNAPGAEEFGKMAKAKLGN